MFDLTDDQLNGDNLIATSTQDRVVRGKFDNKYGSIFCEFKISDLDLRKGFERCNKFEMIPSTYSVLSRNFRQYGYHISPEPHHPSGFIVKKTVGLAETPVDTEFFDSPMNGGVLERCYFFNKHNELSPDYNILLNLITATFAVKHKFKGKGTYPDWFAVSGGEVYSTDEETDMDMDSLQSLGEYIYPHLKEYFFVVLRVTTAEGFSSTKHYIRTTDKFVPCDNGFKDIEDILFGSYRKTKGLSDAIVSSAKTTHQTKSLNFGESGFDDRYLPKPSQKLPSDITEILYWLEPNDARILALCIGRAITGYSGSTINGEKITHFARMLPIMVGSPGIGKSWFFRDGLFKALGDLGFEFATAEFSQFGLSECVFKDFTHIDDINLGELKNIFGSGKIKSIVSGSLTPLDVKHGRLMQAYPTTQLFICANEWDEKLFWGVDGGLKNRVLPLIVKNKGDIKGREDIRVHYQDECRKYGCTVETWFIHLAGLCLEYFLESHKTLADDLKSLRQSTYNAESSSSKDLANVMWQMSYIATDGKYVPEKVRDSALALTVRWLGSIVHHAKDNDLEGMKKFFSEQMPNFDVSTLMQSVGNQTNYRLFISDCTDITTLISEDNRSKKRNDEVSDNVAAMCSRLLTKQGLHLDLHIGRLNSIWSDIAGDTNQPQPCEFLLKYSHLLKDGEGNGGGATLARLLQAYETNLIGNALRKE